MTYVALLASTEDDLQSSIYYFHTVASKYRMWQNKVYKLKIYCDQTNSNITTQFLAEHFLTLQDFFTSVQYGDHWLCGRHPYDILINAIALIGVTFLDKL
jgi:hypothetical protein